MASIRIDNASDDSVTVTLDTTVYVLADDEKLTIQNLEKGRYTLKVHRTRVPQETADSHETDNSDFRAKAENNDKSVHTQLDGIYEIELSSSKAVIAVQQSISAVEKISADAIFSGYSLNVTGSKVLSEKKIFANTRVRKKYIAHQLSNAFLPIGLVGIILFILGMSSVFANLGGGAINLGGRDFSLPWSIGLTAIGAACIAYMIFVVVKTFFTAKKYTP